MNKIFLEPKGDHLRVQDKMKIQESTKMNLWSMITKLF